MEKVYRKNSKGRYEVIGYNNIPDLSDGIWLVQNKPGCKSTTSLVWKVGDLKRPVDIVTHASLHVMSDDLVNYLMKLGDIESDEYKEAANIMGGYIRGPIHFTNISASDIVSLLIRQIAISHE
jgi:hypothetical protein